MTVSPVAEGGDALARVRRENETLYAVIKTVSSSLDLDRVLGGIVDIATDATGCHACFIYFVERRPAGAAGGVAALLASGRRARAGDSTRG